MSTKTKTTPAAKTTTTAKKAPVKTKTTDTAAAPKKVLPVQAPAATVVEQPQPVILGPIMRKRELVELVVTRSGVKKKDAKPVVEAVLATLGEALADGRELILPPMGRMMIRKERMVANARIMTLKVRQSTGSPTPKAQDPKTPAGAPVKPSLEAKKPEPETV